MISDRENSLYGRSTACRSCASTSSAALLWLPPPESAMYSEVSVWTLAMSGGLMSSTSNGRIASGARTPAEYPTVEAIRRDTARWVPPWPDKSSLASNLKKPPRTEGVHRGTEAPN